MKKIVIIIPNAKLDNLVEFKNNIETSLANYETNFIFMHENVKTEDEALPNCTFIQVDEKMSYSQRITMAFKNLDYDAVIIADFTSPNYQEYISQLIKAWKGGSSIIRLKYKPAKQGFFYKVGQFFVKIKDAIVNSFAKLVGLSKDSKCYNTFQLFDKDVADLIENLPEKNSYLRNSKALANFNQSEIYTDEKIKIKNQKVGCDKFLITSIILFILFLTSLVLGIVFIPKAPQDKVLTYVTFLLFLLVGFAGFGIYCLSKFYLKYKYNK